VITDIMPEKCEDFNKHVKAVETIHENIVDFVSEPVRR
jgi:hypothetical protein